MDDGTLPRCGTKASRLVSSLPFDVPQWRASSIDMVTPTRPLVEPRNKKTIISIIPPPRADIQNTNAIGTRGATNREPD